MGSFNDDNSYINSHNSIQLSDPSDAINGTDPSNAETQVVYIVPSKGTQRLPAGSDRTSRNLEYYNRPIAEPSEISSLLTHRTMRAKFSQKLQSTVKNRNFIVDLLTIFFGIGTWVGINGTFIQLPLLVQEAPEGWSLPSYLSVMVQFGNLGPLVYTLIVRFANHKNSDASMIYGLLTVGTISSLLTAFFFNRTAQLFGQEHSVALFVLTFFTALNACTSSVLYMPYMGRFKEIYLVTYFIGEGLSGLLPSVVALIQGIGGAAECIATNATNATTGEPIFESYKSPPRFGTMAFFIFVFVMMLLSCIGFTLLDRLKLARKEYAAMRVSNGNNYVYDREDKTDTNTNIAAVEHSAEANAGLTPEISTFQYRLLLLLICIISFFSNGVFNSIQSYSAMPYGNKAYHLSTTLSVIANPVACFLAVFLPRKSLLSILTLFVVSGILTSYVLVTALMSPLPPLHGTVVGEVIVITTWTLLIGIVSYSKLCITAVMRDQGGKSLVWTGGLTQLGSTFGSLLIFVLINYTNSFQASYIEEC